jgi:hypothetical protein
MRGNSDESNCFTRAGAEALANRRRAGFLLDAWRYQIARGLDGKGREETGNGKQEKRARGTGDIDIARRRAESRRMVNPMHTSNHKKQIVKSSCRLVIDPCLGAYLRPLADARFEFVGNVEDIDRLARENIITVAEAAKRISLKPKTLYCWIEKGLLRVEHGLLRIGGKVLRIDWAIFKACLDRGEFVGSDASCS